MGGSLIEARKRLPSLRDLDQAAALLNIPGMDDAERNQGGAAGKDRRLGGTVRQGRPGARGRTVGVDRAAAAGGGAQVPAPGAGSGARPAASRWPPLCPGGT